MFINSSWTYDYHQLKQAGGKKHPTDTQTNDKHVCCDNHKSHPINK